MVRYSAHVSRRSILGTASIGIAASGIAACSQASSPSSEGTRTTGDAQGGSGSAGSTASAPASGEPDAPSLDDLVTEVQGKFTQEAYSEIPAKNSLSMYSYPRGILLNKLMTQWRGWVGS